MCISMDVGLSIQHWISTRNGNGCLHQDIYIYIGRSERRTFLGPFIFVNIFGSVQ